MDIGKLKRNPEAVKAVLIEKNDRLLTKAALKLYFPVRFAEKKLAEVGRDVSSVGYYAMVVGDQYCVSKVCATQIFKPDSLKIVSIQEVDYYELSFEPGSVVIQNLNLVKLDTLAYFVFDELISKGNIPWYFNLEDMLTLFKSVGKYAGVSLGNSNVVLELIASSIARDPSDRTKYFRHQVKNPTDRQNPVVFIPFRSVVYGATNTTAKLLGANFDDNLLSALANPSEKVETVESLLRM